MKKLEYQSIWTAKPFQHLMNLFEVVYSHNIGYDFRSFVLVSIMFGYDTTPNFVAGVAVAQIVNFAICAR